MKTTILKIFAALACTCLLLNFSPALLNNTNLAWVNLDSLSLRRNFYFGKRQWLADARTIVAAVRYLYQTASADPTNSINIVSNAPLALMQSDGANNLLAMNGAESTILFRERRLSRAESLIVRKRLISWYGLLTSDSVIENQTVTISPHLLRGVMPPTNAAASGLRNLPSDIRVIRMQGA